MNAPSSHKQTISANQRKDTLMIKRTQKKVLEYAAALVRINLKMELEKNHKNLRRQ